MANNDLTINSIDECKETELQEFGIDIHEHLEPRSECCIYKVPVDLRKINEAAYTPQLISIGPLHHFNKELHDMEKQKKRYKREFNNRINSETWQKFVSFIEEHEELIRNLYAEMPKFDKLKFLTMVLYDAVFIIELFLRRFEDKRDFLLDNPGIRSLVALDLLLLENQLPYFVLKELYSLAYPNRVYGPPFLSLSSEYFSCYTGIETVEVVDLEVKHFTDLVRHITTTTSPRQPPRNFFSDLPCSVKLQESGVKFKGTEGCWLDIRFEKRKSRMPWFQASELQIPRIEIYDQTECMIRNVMAFDQIHYPGETLLCNYINLMDNLINTKADVDLLVDAKIITNSVGDTRRIAQMFNKLCLQINLSESCYWKIEEDLKAHYNNRCNHAMTTLKTVYFSNYWRGTGTIAAIVLLLLTLVQTVFSILQVV